MIQVTTSSCSGSSADVNAPVSLLDVMPALTADAQHAAELEALRNELRQFRNERQEMMQLLGSTRPDRVIHDLRNLIQERIFLEAAIKQNGG